MSTINPYINFNGNAEKAFEFYKSVFGGEFTTKMKFKDVASEHTLPPTEGEKIMHVSLPIGPNTVLMGCDVPETYGKAIVGTNFNISVSTESTEEADKLFAGLSKGGTVTMPLEKTFWGSYFGMLTDQFDIQWMVSYDYK